VFFACITFCFGVVYAATQVQSNVQPGSAIVAASGELRDRPEGLITLDMMVTDGTGTPVSGLTALDFHLFENGRAQKILSFQQFTGRGAGAEPPVKVILLIDSLRISPELARDERNAVLFYLRKNGGRLDRPTSVYMLSETGLWTVNGPSEDGNALARELEHNQVAMVRHETSGRVDFTTLGPPGGPATPRPIVAPLEESLKALGRIATNERRQPGRKLLLWVGPGWGIGSGAAGDLKSDRGLFATICWFSTLLREAHLALYSFSVGETDPRAHLYKEYLAGVRSPNRAASMNLNRKVLAVQSGGRVVDPLPDIESEIENCVREDGSFYRISFDPFAAENQNDYHDLKVEIEEPGLKARTNTGYYDHPYYSTDQIPQLKQVSLEELQRILELDESDTAKASQLKGTELTRRLSERRLAILFAIAHGKRTRQQLRILADASSFLDPPSDEILAAPPPSPDEQEHMISMASLYLTGAIEKLPDYFARRITTRYQETAMYPDAGVNFQPLHQTDSSTSTVRYRHGTEVSDAKSHSLKLGNPELVTWGIFGPALQDAFNSIRKSGRWAWIRWEKVTAGRAGVFRSTIALDQSQRYVWACCTPDGEGNQVYQRYAAYHVEIAIDPDTGAILRLSFQFDLESTTPLTRSDIMIEYGPIEIGGKTYNCPLRSVSIVRGRSVNFLSDWADFFRSYGPYATMLNDITFDRYHMFRSESRILTGFTPDEK
jgi:VWFA-related protein